MNIVFDFGAVLFGWQPAQLLQQVFGARAGDSLQDARQMAHQIFGHPDWHAFDQGLLDADAVVQRVAERLALPLPAVHELVHGIGERLRPLDDTVALLQGLCQRRSAGQGVHALYYLSNMPVPYARLLEQRHAFVHWFDGGLFSGDVRLIKPDPAIYLLLQQRYLLPPAQTLFIDDLKANVHAAQALGWHGIHFESAAQLQAELQQFAL